MKGGAHDPRTMYSPVSGWPLFDQPSFSLLLMWTEQDILLTWIRHFPHFLESQAPNPGSESHFWFLDHNCLQPNISVFPTNVDFTSQCWVSQTRTSYSVLSAIEDYRTNNFHRHSWVTHLDATLIHTAICSSKTSQSQHPYLCRCHLQSSYPTPLPFDLGPGLSIRFTFVTRARTTASQSSLRLVVGKYRVLHAISPFCWYQFSHTIGFQLHWCLRPVPFLYSWDCFRIRDLTGWGGDHRFVDFQLSFVVSLVDWYEF